MFRFGKKVKTVVVHGGTFHADDVFVIAVLRLVFGKNNIKIIRTRDADLINKADIVADVGAVYNPDTLRFDHHQQGGAGKRENGIPYASFGLVWKHFGKQLVTEDEWKIIDNDYVAPVDAGDCGFEIAQSSVDGVVEVNADTIIKLFNPTWQENGLVTDKQFEKAVTIAEAVLDRMIQKSKAKSAAKIIAKTLYEKATDKRVVVLDRPMSADSFIPYSDILYIIYPSEENWQLRALPIKKDSFTLRKPLPQSWGGKMDVELAKVTSVEDSVFCHSGLFLAVSKTKEGAVALAHIALKG